jgi:hypothetical protein
MIYDLKFGAFLKEIAVCESMTIRKGKESWNEPNGRVGIEG